MQTNTMRSLINDLRNNSNNIESQIEEFNSPFSMNLYESDGQINLIKEKG